MIQLKYQGMYKLNTRKQEPLFYYDLFKRIWKNINKLDNPKLLTHDTIYELLQKTIITSDEYYLIKKSPNFNLACKYAITKCPQKEKYCNYCPFISRKGKMDECKIPYFKEYEIYINHIIECKRTHQKIDIKVYRKVKQLINSILKLKIRPGVNLIDIQGSNLFSQHEMKGG